MTCEIYCFSKGATSIGAFGSSTSTKRQGACVEHQKWQAGWSDPTSQIVCGLDGPSWQGIRSVMEQNQVGFLISCRIC
jgi:hypothetical protein